MCERAGLCLIRRRGFGGRSKKARGNRFISPEGGGVSGVGGGVGCVESGGGGGVFVWRGITCVTL